MKILGILFNSFLMSFIFIYSSCNSYNDHMVDTLSIQDGWKFRRVGDTEWLPAKIPGTIHTDLFNNHIIEDPFYRLNEKDQQWIDKEDWEYTCTFNVDKKVWKKEKIFLKFYGLDTYAQVFLNDSSILSADNMFREWKVDVKSYLTEGNNTLTVRFYSAINKGYEKLNAFGYNLPASNDLSEIGGVGKDKLSVFTRKAPYHYGWDWGPRFVTCGIWRNVELISYDVAEIENIHYRILSASDEKAGLEAGFELNSVKEGEFKVTILDNISGKVFLQKDIDLKEGKNNVNLSINIDKPALWWPNGLGEANLYELKAILEYKEKLADEYIDKVGIRTIELVNEQDSAGKSFYFKVNGIPVFAKGANYIPNDNFVPRVTREKYRLILESARKSNMNMIRVWGGGIYENDIFYDLCDELGLMVWQDFMFACSMYPGDNDFLKNVKLEAEDNVKRLRNHPCLALWCGNNEIDVAWCQYHELCGWVWKQRYNSQQREQLWQAYKHIFLEILPAVIKELDPDRSYWPSSPMADWGKAASNKTVNEGDMHYWGVWHGKKPFEEFDEVVGRFMSEYGFQSFPDINTVKKYTLEEDLDIESEVMASHQRSGIGNLRIKEYMGWYYKVPDDFEHFLYVGQILQAKGIREAIETHRLKMPHCMGSLYWQLNDCWPVASWSSIDYYGRWKALQYAARKAFAPTIVTFSEEGKSMKVFAVNDLLDEIKAELEIDVFSFTGQKVFSNKKEVIVLPNASTELATYSIKDLFNGIHKNEGYVVSRIKNNEELIASNIYYAVYPKKLELSKPDINISIRRVKDAYMIVLQTDVLAKNVYLSSPVEGHFTDNYFDLLSEEKKTVFFIPGEDTENNIPEIQILTLADLY